MPTARPSRFSRWRWPLFRGRSANLRASLLCWTAVFTWPRVICYWAVLWWSIVGGGLPSRGLDLTSALVVHPPEMSATERQAVTMLVDEVRQRTGITWAVATEIPRQASVLILVGQWSSLRDLWLPVAKEGEAAPPGPEGFRLAVRQTGAKGSAAAGRVLVAGSDARGVLFGVGRLLRALDWCEGQVAVSDALDVSTAPKYSLRGHQLGYRPKTNSYDAWDVPQWEQYYRDLAIFGTNAVELVPPRTDDDATSPHFPRPQTEMLREMSGLADRYGLDVWIWYPALDRHYDDETTVRQALEEWDANFALMPRIDAVFVPGGDPGKTPPRLLLNLLARQTEVLHRTHPKAQMWVSPQSFSETWLAEFLRILREERPAWLSGVVFGPQVRLSLADLREAVPRQYPIRHYPDITHCRQCQYPVPEWDFVWAVTNARECINPRPRDQAIIFRRIQPQAMGFLTYSEGCNDDVNKFVWSGLGWDPDQDVLEILRQYSQWFIGSEYRDSFAQLLLGLEENWRGRAMTNPQVPVTLQQARDLERGASERVRGNWRFQAALYRAYYDAYVQRRLLHEQAAEAAAVDQLAEAARAGSRAAMQAAGKTLDEAVVQRPAAALRQRVFELADALFHSIRLQSSVEKYQAKAVDRGATLDTVDYPLNNRDWLREQFARIDKLDTEEARLAAIERLLSWSDPGPGGYYDDLGNPLAQPHLVPGLTYAEDPASLRSPRCAVEEAPVLDGPDQRLPGPLRTTWIDHAETLREMPLHLRYTGLDPEAKYRLRVVYGGDAPEKQIRLEADERHEIHPLLTKPFPYRPLEFDIPVEATVDGELNLRWYRQPGLGDNGRGSQVSEAWLLRVAPAQP